MPEEKRRFPRYAVALPVELKDKGRVQELVTSDASRHGVFLRTDSPRPVRQLVQLTFQLPEGGTIDVMGMVARSLPPAEAGTQGPGMGVDFFAMSKDARDVWEGFVRTLARAEQSGRPTVAPGAGVAVPPAEPPAAPPAEPPAEPPVQKAATVPQPEGSVTMRAPRRQEEARMKSRASEPPERARRPIPQPEGSVTMRAPRRQEEARMKSRTSDGTEAERVPRRSPPTGRLDQLFDELPEDASLPDEDPGAAAAALPDDEAPPPAPVRRKQLRYVASFMVRLKDKARLRQFYTRDIGGGGMFLKTPLLKKEGDDVQLVLIHPESDQEFRLGGTVARVSKDAVMAKRGMGIRFHPRNEAEEQALLTFIDTGAEFLDPSPDERESTITSLKTAIKVAPDSPRAHFMLGKALLDQDRLIEAMEELDKALLLDLDYLPAHRALQEAHTRNGNTAKAFEHLKQVKRLEREGWQDKDSA